MNVVLREPAMSSCDKISINTKLYTFKYGIRKTEFQTEFRVKNHIEQ